MKRLRLLLVLALMPEEAFGWFAMPNTVASAPGIVGT